MGCIDNTVAISPPAIVLYKQNSPYSPYTVYNPPCGHGLHRMPPGELNIICFGAKSFSLGQLSHNPTYLVRVPSILVLALNP